MRYILSVVTASLISDVGIALLNRIVHTYIFQLTLAYILFKNILYTASNILYTEGPKSSVKCQMRTPQVGEGPEGVSHMRTKADKGVGKILLTNVLYVRHNMGIDNNR